MRTPVIGLAFTIGFLGLGAVGGCTRVPAAHVSSDRMDYGQVIADSWKRQTLLNVVRLRYADAPVFLDVASVINSYTIAGRANGGAELHVTPDANVASIGAEAAWSNTPTVTYQPIMGDRFTRSMLLPVPPDAVFRLIQSGWPADLVFRTMVDSINGLRNSSVGRPEDPGFHELLEIMNRIQRGTGLSIRVAPEPKAGSLDVVLRRDDQDPALRADTGRARELLGLEEGLTEIPIVYGAIPRNRHELAVLSRSMLEILLQLGFGVEVPPEHATEGRALTGRGQPGAPMPEPLARIRSGKQAPADAYAAISYRGCWYWIDDTDVPSKRVFTFLMILFSLAETGQTSAAPIVTVPSR